MNDLVSVLSDKLIRTEIENASLKARLEALEATLTDLASPDFMVKYRKLERDSARLAEARQEARDAIIEWDADREAWKARLAEAITMLSERDFEYNRKTNALIERRAKQIEGLLARLAEAVKWARERGHRKDCEIHRSYLYKERPCSCGLNQIVRPTDSADVCTWPECRCKRGSDYECAQGYERPTPTPDEVQG